MGGSEVTVPDEVLGRWLPDGLRQPRYVKGIRRYLANTGYGTDDSESSAARVFKQAIKLMEEAKQHQPFALMVDCFDPHEPWSPPPEFVKLYSEPSYRGANPGTARYARADSYLHDDELRQMNAVYAGALTMADKWLGELLGRFRELELHNNTAVILLSDHGILLGDRGWTGKVAGQLHPELMSGSLRRPPCPSIETKRSKLNRNGRKDLVNPRNGLSLADAVQ